MTSAAVFRFSQVSLQEYVECPRRFQLRHVWRLRWPAVDAEPAWEGERYLQEGAAFHRVIQRHLLGIPAGELSGMDQGAELGRWWRSYLDSPPADLPQGGYPETRLSVPVGRSRLVAQYDFVAVDAAQRLVIVDWKTARRRPNRGQLLARLQSRVYPYVLVRAGSVLNDGVRIQPEQVSMVYWFANFPADPIRFEYSREQCEVDHRFLSGLVAEIEERFDGIGERQLVSARVDDRSCRYCRYRSLCERGVAAGLRDDRVREEEIEPLIDGALDFGQIAEIEYG